MSTESDPADATQILRAISHELRNLLQSISGCNQLIEDAIANHQCDQVADYWRIGHQKQEALSKVIQDILFLGEAGIPQSAETRLSEVVGRAVKSVSRQAELAGVVLDCELLPAGLDKLCVPDILQRCIENVLEFSIRSCPVKEKGQVSVSVRRNVSNQTITIEIVDNGCHLNAEELKLFANQWLEMDQWDRFLISLAVARKIAKGLGGEWAVKNGDGSGKSFILTIVDPKGSDQWSRFCDR